ncbi:hypothetical protein ACMYSQ_011651 [Aspergillus niger]
MLPMSWATSTSFTDVQDFDYYHDSVSIFLVVRQTGRDEVEGGATDKILIPLSPSWSHRCRFVHRSSLMPRELKATPKHPITTTSLSLVGPTSNSTSTLPTPYDADSPGYQPTHPNALLPFVRSPLGLPQ